MSFCINFWSFAAIHSTYSKMHKLCVIENCDEMRMLKKKRQNSWEPHIPCVSYFPNETREEKRERARAKPSSSFSIFRESGSFQWSQRHRLISYKHLHNYTRNRQNNANNESQAKWLAVSLYLIVIVNGLLCVHA